MTYIGLCGEEVSVSGFISQASEQTETPMMPVVVSLFGLETYTWASVEVPVI